MKFRIVSGQQIDNLIKYCVGQKLDGAKIHIGCDSIVVAGNITYITVIAFRIGKSGVHFIYDKTKIKSYRDSYNKPDIFTRLWKEAQFTIDTANLLIESGLFNHNEIVLEFDYNNVKDTISTKVIAAAVGYAVGSGYTNNLLKSDVQIAVKAANNICQIK